MDVWIEIPPTNIDHPAKRPLDCWTQLVNLLSNENDLVLDPFLGSGTTAIACINTGINYIGFEKDEIYFKLLNERINKYSQIKKTANLFE